MASPTDRMGLDLSTAHDGERVTHTFRQSWLGDLDHCPEQARLKMIGQYPRGGTDATDAGTAVHAAAEAGVAASQNDVWLTVPELVEIAQDEFTAMIAAPEFRWVQMTEQAARTFIDKAVHAWARDVWPTLDPIGVEVNFGPLLVHEDDQRVINIAGTMDLHDRTGIKDYKTAGSEYKRWERARWATQPTVYTLAAHKLGLEIPWTTDGTPFEYIVFVKPHATVQRLTVYRHQGHWDWLVARCVAAAKLVEADLDQWPTNDQHALCSPKWCLAWDACKGRHFAADWPKTDRPVPVHISE